MFHYQRCHLGLESRELIEQLEITGKLVIGAKREELLHHGWHEGLVWDLQGKFLRSAWRTIHSPNRGIYLTVEKLILGSRNAE